MAFKNNRVYVFLPMLQIYLKCVTNMIQISEMQAIIVMTCHNIKTGLFTKR